jgi:hypothetical protein
VIPIGIPVDTLLGYVYRSTSTPDPGRVPGRNNRVNLDGVERVTYNDARLTATNAIAAATSYRAANSTIFGQNNWADSSARTDQGIIQSPSDAEQCAAPYRLENAS